MEPDVDNGDWLECIVIGVDGVEFDCHHVAFEGRVSGDSANVIIIGDALADEGCHPRCGRGEARLENAVGGEGP